MSALIPNRVSIYDYLYLITQPIDPIIADVGKASIPQARVLINNGIQAFTSALLAYNQQHATEDIIKKIFNHAYIKDISQYNAFNSTFMTHVSNVGPSLSEELFGKRTLNTVLNNISKKADLSIDKTRFIFSALVVLCVREISLLANVAKLNANEVNDWFNLQFQFLKLNRKINSINKNELLINYENDDSDINQTPQFKPYWFELTGYEVPELTKIMQQPANLPHYAKVIGRQTSLQNKNIEDSPTNKLIVDSSNGKDILTFYAMDNISLPYQRWLLQLAKVSDIYLKRNRLKIASEPAQPPSKPFVNLDFINSGPEKADNILGDDNDNLEDAKMPFWRNPVFILIMVLGLLGLLAVIKYYNVNQPVNSNEPILTKNTTSAI